MHLSLGGIRIGSLSRPLSLFDRSHGTLFIADPVGAPQGLFAIDTHLPFTYHQSACMNVFHEVLQPHF
jgi:hypothetical protein